MHDEMNHFTVLTDDVEPPSISTVTSSGSPKARGPRSASPVPGSTPAGKPMLHVIGGRPQDELRAGVIDHMAFSALACATRSRRSIANGIKYKCRQQTGSGMWQVFLHDPNGARVELDFAAERSRSAASMTRTVMSAAAVGSTTSSSPLRPSRTASNMFESAGVRRSPAASTSRWARTMRSCGLVRATYLEMIAIDPAGIKPRDRDGSSSTTRGCRRSSPRGRASSTGSRGRGIERPLRARDADSARSTRWHAAPIAGESRSPTTARSRPRGSFPR